MDVVEVAKDFEGFTSEVAFASFEAGDFGMAVVASSIAIDMVRIDVISSLVTFVLFTKLCSVTV